MDAQIALKRLQNLEEAIAEGILEVEFQGRRTKYRSLSEMQQIVNSLKREIEGKSEGIKFSIAVFEKY